MNVLTSESERKFIQKAEDEALGDGDDHLDISLCQWPNWDLPKALAEIEKRFDARVSSEGIYHLHDKIETVENRQIYQTRKIKDKISEVTLQQ